MRRKQDSTIKRERATYGPWEHSQWKGRKLTLERKRAKLIIDHLRKEYGVVECSLDERFDPWRLLVSAILAAQCTDARVNLVTPALFQRFPDPQAFTEASPAEIAPYISSCGLFRNKAKAIYHAACVLMENFQGKVPSDLDDLLSIPGVGRKIAHLIRGDSFDLPGLVVDTHCMRLAQLLGFTEKTTAFPVEKDLCAVVEKEDWTDWGHYMVEHGRAVCIARRPRCQSCCLRTLCSYGKTKEREKKLRPQ